MRELVVDTNVLVGALNKSDPHFGKAWPLYQSMRRGRTLFHLPMLVPVEACGVLLRKCGVHEAKRFRRQLRRYIRQGRMKLYELSRERMDKAISLVISHYLYGADAIVLQVVQELKVALETYDGNLEKAAQSL